MNCAIRTLVGLYVALLVSCRAADPAILAVAKEWRDRADLKLPTVVDEADFIVTATVTNADGCPSTSWLKSSAQRSDGLILGCATLHVIEVMRGEPSGSDIEVLYLDHRGSNGNAMVRRMPIGTNGSMGIYLLCRRAGRLWAILAEQRSYIQVSSQSYVPYSRQVSINETLAKNLVGSNVWDAAALGETVLRVSAAIQLTDLYRVVSMLERLTKSEDRNVAISSCMLLTARFIGVADCAPRLKKMAMSSPESAHALETAEVEGKRQVLLLTKILSSRDRVVLMGLLNAAPGGACEYVRLLSNHGVDSIRVLARNRIEDTCRSD